MSLHEYNESKRIGALDPPFYALIMAAMRGADTRNADLLRRAFPETWDELQARYDAPGGLLPGEKVAVEAPGAWPEGGLPHGEHPYDYGYTDDATVLGFCPHGVNLDRDFCEHGCRA